VTVSLLYQLTRRLLSVSAVLLHRDTAKDTELLVLQHENAVLRRQITSQVWYQPADRFWFATTVHAAPRHRWPEIFPVQPATILAWQREPQLIPLPVFHAEDMDILTNAPQAPRMNAHCERSSEPSATRSATTF
jgi:hypothetical protein